jgi:hypothetical protein
LEHAPSALRVSIHSVTRAIVESMFSDPSF